MAMVIGVLRFLAAAGLSVLFSASSGAAETVTIKIGYPAGGGFDLSGRLVARHLGAHLDGKPSFVVQNVPGGGSLKLTEMMQESEPGDGSVIGMVGPSMATAPLLDPTMQHLRATEFRWIGGLRNEASVCFTGKKSGVTTVDDFRTADILIGASGKASTTYLHAAMVKAVLGARFTIVTGFQGINDIDAAIERGEIAGRCSATYSSLRSMGLLDGVNVILTVVADADTDTASVPLLSDLATSQRDRDAIQVIAGTLTFHHPLLLPASASPEIVAAYRAAFDRMVRDPAFLAEAETLKVEISATGGARIDELVKGYYASPPETIARARELIR